MRYFNIILAVTLLASSQINLKADEGMWMIQDINAALEKKMQERGLKLSANEIYNADAPGSSVSDAIVSLGFYCSGSIISDEGLLITNHHCAYGDVHDLSTPEHNYLEEGYWAMRAEDEIPIPGKQVFFLKKVLDVTEEAEALVEDGAKEGKKVGYRKLCYLLEKKYKNDTGFEASLSSMWSGEKYYMALYEMYTDLRLVAAPPVSIAAFGGDVDNWEWPQHKCDFAMYRVYTGPDGKPADYSANNIPLKPLRKLEISLDGYKKGDFTMVIGYPGRTNRYSSSMEVSFDQKVSLPISNEFRGKQMATMMKWMNSDPAIRLKYSDYYFNLSNVQENDLGRAKCLGRFRVSDQKCCQEKELQEWIDSDNQRKAKWGGMMNSLGKGYSESSFVEKNKQYYTETMFRGTRVALVFMRMSNAKDSLSALKALQTTYPTMDPRVEHDLLANAIGSFYENVDSSFWGPYQKALKKRYGSDYETLTDDLWNESLVSSYDKALKFKYSQLDNDPLNKFFEDVSVMEFNKFDNSLERRTEITNENREYTHAMYRMNKAKGRPQYPDANFSMRLSYGVVSTLSPADAVEYSWHTTANGLLQKDDTSSYDFRLGDRQRALLKAGDWGKWGVGGAKTGKMAVKSDLYIDFLTDNDITGGNSGSPVLNAEGQLIGLAFDGNIESLASDNFYTPDYNKCVCVDIRAVLWTVDKYAGMSRIMTELGL